MHKTRKLMYHADSSPPPVFFYRLLLFLFAYSMAEQTTAQNSPSVSPSQYRRREYRQTYLCVWGKTKRRERTRTGTKSPEERDGRDREKELNYLPLFLPLTLLISPRSANERQTRRKKETKRQTPRCSLQGMQPAVVHANQDGSFTCSLPPVGSSGHPSEQKKRLREQGSRPHCLPTQSERVS